MELLQWLPESIKKCTIKYLLNRYLGRYFSEDLDLSQLNVDIIKGRGSIDGIPLNLNTINEELSPLFPLKLTDGFVNRIEVLVPWSSIWTDSLTFCLKDIKLSFYKMNKCPAQDLNQASSILSKSLTTSSMEIAEEIVNQDPDKFEGLEKFAELINSVIRRLKVFAKNTVVKFVIPHKRGASHEIQLRIGHLICEEEEINLDSKDTKDGKCNMLSDVVTKRITIEGIEVLINDTQITKLTGKHTFKIRFDENHVDVKAFFGSYIFAYLNLDHLIILQEFFQFDDNKMDNLLPKERLMTSQDYRRVREIIQTESKQSKHQNSVTSSRISQNSNYWTSDNAEEDITFMSFNVNIPASKDKESTTSKFNCNVKIPGVVLCLITGDNGNMSKFREMPILDPSQSFIGFNSYLNDVLQDYDHIRLLASNLCLSIASNNVGFTFLNFSTYEYHHASLNNILWVKDSESDVIEPSVRVSMSNNNIDIKLTSTSVILDPTLIERHSKLLTLVGLGDSERTSVNSQYRPAKGKPSDVCLNIDCDNVDIVLYFPIPDLRPTRNEYSRLHDEILLVEFADISVRIDSSGGELLCKQVNIDMKLQQNVKKIFTAQSEQKDIKLYLSTANPSNVVDLIDENALLNQMTSMQESINFLQSSTISHQKDCDPFQVKRKMFGDESGEQILTPGDHDHAQRYLSHHKNCTKTFLYINMPTGTVYLENKEMFELIYNRFVNDLILWTPFLKENAIDIDIQLSTENSENPFKQPLPEIAFPVSHESLASNLCTYPQSPPAINSGAFFSCKEMTESCDSVASDASFHSVANSTVDAGTPQNEFMLEMEINNANIFFYTESRQRNSLYMQNLLLGIVVGPVKNGSTVINFCSENLTYLVEDRQVIIGNTFLETNNTSTLNMSINIKRETEILKKIKMAIQLNRALLLGIDLPIFEQLYEFVNVKDDDILGYVCPKVVLELHGDVVQSGVSFENLKDRPTLLHCEEVYLTTMVVENTNQTILRFFIEEALLCFKRNNLCQDLLKNYVSVINSGVIDLNMKISKDGRIELKLSNNVISVKTCPDSFVALCQFFQSFAPQGGEDVANYDGDDLNEIHTSQKNQNGTELIADALYECTNQDVKSDEKGCSCDTPKLDDSTFWILDDDLGTGINFSQEPQIRVLVNEPIQIIDNHFKITNYNVIPDVNASTLARYLLERLSLRVAIFDGKDFDDVTIDDDDDEELKNKKNSKLDVISQANLSMRSVKSSMSNTQSHRTDPRVRFVENSVVWENIDLVSNNGYMMNNMPAETHYSIRSMGGVNRKTDTSVVFVFNRIKMLFENFDKNYELAWRFYFFVEEIEILDQVNSSKIKKILYEYFSESIPRRKYSNMFSIQLNCHRNFQDMNEESDLKVSIKPLRVNIDQDTLMFIIQYFTTVSEILNSKTNNNNDVDSKAMNSENKCFNEDFKDDSSMDYNEDDNESCNSKTLSVSPTDGDFNRPRRDSSSSVGGTFEKIYIKSYIFAPDVPIRLDYHGKYIDLKNVCLFLSLVSIGIFTD